MKKLSKLAFPIIISQLIAQLMVLSDVWMMSQMSLTVLAAGGLAAAVYAFIISLGHSIVSVVANLLAIAHGGMQKNPSAQGEIRRIIKGGILLALLLSLLTIPIFYALPQLLHFMGQDAKIIQLAMEYIHALKWSMLPILLLVVFRGLPIAFGRSRSVFYVSVTMVITNCLLSYLLAFQFDLGISGLGWGTVVAAVFTVASYAGWLFSRANFYYFRPWSAWQEYQLSTVKPILQMGLPVGLATITEYSLISGAALMAGTMGAIFLATHQIVFQVLSFSWNIAFGFAQATSLTVGNEYGANASLTVIRKISFNGLLLATLASITVGTICIQYPEMLISAFSANNDKLPTQLTSVLPSVTLIAAGCFIVDAWQLTLLNILRGMKVVFMPAMYTIVGYCAIGLPTSWLLLPEFKLSGIWAGIGIGLAVTGCLLMLHLHFSLKKLASATPPHGVTKQQIALRAVSAR